MTKKLLGGIAACLLLVGAIVLSRPSGPDCPESGAGIDGESTVPLAGAITNIPQFHDCQRLIEVADGGKDRRYGALAGLWVSEQLARLPDSLRLLNLTVPVAASPAPDTAPASTISLISGVRALPFAQIYAWDGAYQPLGIGKGWNCLYLFPAESPSGLAARMVQQDARECGGTPAAADLEGKLLAVHRSRPVDSESDYPPVGRWDWDQERQRQYIGLGCGGAWCDITDTGAHTSSSAYAIGEGSAEAKRVYAVKGWYDEQPLARPSRFGDARPAPTLGTVVPDAGLDSVPDVARFRDNWIAAGVVALQFGLREYRERLNLWRGRLPRGGNVEGLTRVSLCLDGGSGCGILDDERPSCRESGGWYARIVAPDSAATTKYYCVARRADEVSGRWIPATVRWRWARGGESLVFRCADGSCFIL